MASRKKNCKHLLYVDLPIFIFQEINCLLQRFFNFNMMSIWSEDNIFAKTLANEVTSNIT